MLYAGRLLFPCRISLRNFWVRPPCPRLIMRANAIPTWKAWSPQIMRKRKSAGVGGSWCPNWSDPDHPPLPEMAIALHLSSTPFPFNVTRAGQPLLRSRKTTCGIPVSRRFDSSLGFRSQRETRRSACPICQELFDPPRINCVGFISELLPGGSGLESAPDGQAEELAAGLTRF